MVLPEIVYLQKGEKINSWGLAPPRGLCTCTAMVLAHKSDVPAGGGESTVVMQVGAVFLLP